MVGCNIGNDSDITMLKGESVAQDATTCRFQYREVYCGITQYKLSAYRSGAITFHHQLVLYVHPIAGGITHFFTGSFANVSSKPCSSSFAIGAGNGDDWNTTISTVRK